MDKLSEFVEEQLRKGANKNELKTHLLMNGWRESDVDSAIYHAQGHKTRKTIIISAVFVLIIGALILSLIALTKNPTNIPNTPNTPINNPNTNENPISPNELKTDKPYEICMNKETSSQKDECYKLLIRTGFSCRSITEKVELTYCNRAYEDLMLKGVDRIEEN